MYVRNEDEINPLIQNHSQIPVPKQISRSFFFRLKYFLGMFSSLSLSFLSIAIVNITLFVLNFLNLPQGDILTRAEKHFEELKDTSLPSAHLVPRQVNEAMEIWETNPTGKGVCLYFPRWIQQTHMASSSEDRTQGVPQPLR